MLFNSLQYFIFLPVVLLFYYALGQRGQNRLLLVASYIFYGAWDWRFLGLIWLSTVVDYFAGLAIDRTADPQRRKRFLILSLVVNLGILGLFKYFNFFVGSAARLITLFGFNANVPLLTIVLPVGVSFYTFQAITYTVDIYRGQMKPVRSFLDYALFVCYFPQLMAGPIERARHLLPKLQSQRVVTTDHVVTGCTLILTGLFRKVVIADGIAPRVNGIFAAPSAHSTPELIGGLLLFALQIYCDFAGYSDIARGSSRLLGIDLMVNFRQPYFASNISEFWRRWHISLSTWLRDYLYIPLGGSRHGTLGTYRNLMITMLLGGLWHGASWNFVIWGGLHGAYLVAHRLYHQVRGLPIGGPNERLGWRRLPGLLLTFTCVVFAWTFFRAPGLASALDYLSGIAALRGLNTWTAVMPVVVIPWLLILPIDIPQFLSDDQTVLLTWPRLTRTAAVVAMFFLVILAFGQNAPFIYFQF